MKSPAFPILFLLLFVSPALMLAYEESISDMLMKCNEYQSEVFSDNRTAHQCEKDNFSEQFSYVIQEMETHYSKKKFLCFVFFKENLFKLKFKIWFSHKNFAVDAVSRNKVQRKQIKIAVASSMVSSTTSRTMTNGSQEFYSR